MDTDLDLIVTTAFITLSAVVTLGFILYMVRDWRKTTRETAARELNTRFERVARETEAKIREIVREEIKAQSSRSTELRR